MAVIGVLVLDAGFLGAVVRVESRAASLFRTSVFGCAQEPVSRMPDNYADRVT